MTPWWETLVTGVAGGVVAGLLTLAGVWITQRSTTERDQAKTQAEEKERERQRKIEAYADFLAEDQRMIVAIEQFVLGHITVREVYQQWAALTTASYLVVFRAQLQDVTDGVDELMNSVLPLLALIRLEIHDYRKYDDHVNSHATVGDRLGSIMRQDAIGEAYWPSFGSIPEKPAFLEAVQRNDPVSEEPSPSGSLPYPADDGRPASRAPGDAGKDSDPPAAGT